MNDHHTDQSVIKVPTTNRSKGIPAWKVDHERYIDACAGGLVVLTGHGHRTTRDATVNQLDAIAFACRPENRDQPTLALPSIATRTKGDGIGALLVKAFAVACQ